jgi:hypothetical protein
VLGRARENLVAGMLGDYTRQSRWRRWIGAFHGSGQRRPAEIAAAQHEPESEGYGPSAPRRERIRLLELQD